MIFKYFLYEIRGLLIIIGVASVSSFLTWVGWDSFVAYAHSGVIPIVFCGVVAGAYSFIILAASMYQNNL